MAHAKLVRTSKFWPHFRGIRGGGTDFITSVQVIKNFSILLLYKFFAHTSFTLCVFVVEMFSSQISKVWSWKSDNMSINRTKNAQQTQNKWSNLNWLHLKKISITVHITYSTRKRYDVTNSSLNGRENYRNLEESKAEQSYLYT